MSNGALFFPVDNKRLGDLYPELASRPAIADLTLEEGRFVWWFACKASPFNDPDTGIGNRQEKAKAAFDKAFGKDSDHASKIKYYACQFPPHIMEANEVMSKFNPELRSRAGEGAQKNFDNLLRISELDIQQVMFVTIEDSEGNKTTKFDASAVNSFVGAVQKITEIMPDLIKTLEEGFGINSAVSSDLMSGKTAHEIAMQRNKKTNQR